MTRYVLGRVVQGVVVLVLVAVVVFTISRLSGSPVDQMLPENATDEQRVALTRQLGLDQPLHLQFGSFVGRLLPGTSVVRTASRPRPWTSSCPGWATRSCWPVRP